MVVGRVFSELRSCGWTLDRRHPHLVRLLSASSADETLERQKPDYGKNEAIIVIRPRIMETVRQIIDIEPRIMVSGPPIMVTMHRIMDIGPRIINALRPIMTIRLPIMAAELWLSPPAFK